MNRREFLLTGTILPNCLPILSEIGTLKQAKLNFNYELSNLVVITLLNSYEIMGDTINGSRQGLAWVDHKDAIPVFTKELWIGRLSGKILFRQDVDRRMPTWYTNHYNLEATNGSVFDPPDFCPSSTLNNDRLMFFPRTDEFINLWTGANFNS